MGGDLFAKLTRSLTAVEPPQKGLRFAAVSIVISDRKSPSVLLIRRAEHPGDPWSGQIAFPGGKTKSGDRTVRETAIRETLEEVGIDLASSASFLGYGGVTTTHTGTMDVVPSAFILKEKVAVKPNHEVASFRWVDLKDFMEPSARTTYNLDAGGRVAGMPAFAVGDYVVWGLTYRILSSMLG